MTEKIKRPGRVKTKEKHYLTKHRTRGVWYPELVGLIRGYPRTLEGFEKRRDGMRERVRAMREAGTIKTRRGVPDGWAGRGEEVAAARAEATIEGAKTIETLIEQGVIDAPLTTDEEMAVAALKVVMATALNPTETTRERTAAVNTVLAYCKAKPAQKIEAKVSKAEDFLALLAQEQTST